MDGWEKFYLAVIDETDQGVQQALDQFRTSVGDWFHAAINWPTPAWRDDLHAFVEHSRHYGIELESSTVDGFRELIEARVRGTGVFEALGPYDAEPRAGKRRAVLKLALVVSTGDDTPMARC